MVYDRILIGDRVLDYVLAVKDQAGTYAGVVYAPFGPEAELERDFHDLVLGTRDGDVNSKYRILLGM
ncbi:uncharacterized protein PHALS_09907 [Plasmopara halstedii]|uniref:Uncharacterized protein n=1 Tax=Plasmopara halstedii TaxID=4781 RepID=A0A0P1AF16_PLAHL|nr:uncharacterized protein PHALS_09907 [Plasmopara halstedii]CEG39670.1 hypothetical protein PHALS_09907 [Plasmopara halstedii]|eukprot:XP_024576039.1 hypothetical protein PHALS_09907 [Plasmopara halstedii]